MTVSSVLEQFHATHNQKDHGRKGLKGGSRVSSIDTSERKALTSTRQTGSPKAHALVVEQLVGKGLLKRLEGGKVKVTPAGRSALDQPSYRGSKAQQARSDWFKDKAKRQSRELS